MQQAVRWLTVVAVLGLTAPGVRAADPEGEKAFKETCTGCHNAGSRPLDAMRMSRDKWKQEVERMEGLGADIPSGKRLDVLLNWLAETHGPDAPPPAK